MTTAPISRDSTGKILEREREKAALSQAELAEATGISQPTIWRIENDRQAMGARTLRLICDELAKAGPEQTRDLLLMLTQEHHRP